MKRVFFLISVFLLAINILFGVDENVKKKFEKAQVFKSQQVEVVKFEVMKPDIERYQKKTETDLHAGYYQLYKKNIRTTNKELLNKWLKELK